MFAKLSALAVLLPLVSAFTISVPAKVDIGATVSVIVADVVAADPSVADFYILGPGVDVKLAANVALVATVTLDLPDVDTLVDGAGYVIVATTVGDVNDPLAQTVPFTCVDPDTTSN